MNMDLISVIVPIYNLDAYLYQCVASIVAQTYKHLEIILVDDGSTDNALEICEFFRKSDARVQFINKPNGGLVSARKAGLNASNGQYVFYVDGDDWIDPDCIERYYALACKHHVDLVIADYKREFLGNLVVMRNAIPPGFYDRLAIERDILPRMIYNGEFFNHSVRTYSWGKLYKRSLIAELQNAVPNQIMVAEDAALVYPAVYQAASLYVSDLTHCFYRQRPNSILKSTSFDQNENKRIATAFSYMAKALNAQQTDFGFTEQLRAYFSAITMIRNGAFVDRADLYARYQFFGQLPVGSRLALYNSGSFGQHVYKHLEKNPDFNLVAWFDEDFRENQLLGMPVSAPAALGADSFDFLIVPSFDDKVYAHVQALCAAAKVPENKILPIRFDTHHFSDLIESLGFDPTTFLPLG